MKTNAISPPPPRQVCKHEIKQCPRCGSAFECKMNNIIHCQCTQVSMPNGLPSWVDELYDDCLCPRCLRILATEAKERPEQ
ncbi:cysteine-rich CWC family protein [Cerasicoccus frondis]|uniref:cysteine-rich CWC family protein n=1 Tax=Cerasicoccus frondis TaxID=490090 RepID=UPI0028524FA7|nr:cysteine-rich CWC family protein [Cerasicoccus frondis]